MATFSINKKGLFRNRLVIFSLTLLSIVIGAGLFAAGYLGDIARQGIIKNNESAISILSVQMTGELKKIDGAVLALSGSPAIDSALITRRDQDVMRANLALDRYNKALDASVSYMMDTNGVTIASSNRNAPDNFVGKSYRFRPYFIQAMHGVQGRYFGLGITSLKRGYYASCPVRNKKGEIIGVVTMKTDLDDLETNLSSYPYSFVVTNHGIIFLSGKKEMLFKSLWPVSQEIQRELIASKQFGEKPFEAVLPQEVVDGMNVTLKGNNYIVSRKAISPEGWSIVLMTPADRVVIYKSAGVIMTVLICILLMMPLIITYQTVKTGDIVRRSEERFQQVADSSQDWIWETDEKGHYTYSSQAVKNILGHLPEEIIGKNYYDFFSPDEKEQHIETLKKHFKNNEAFFRVVHRNIHRDGFEVFLESTGSPIVNNNEIIGYRGASRDITERKKADDALHESEKLYRVLAEKSFAGVYVIQNGKFCFINSIAASYAGYTREELIGQESGWIIHPEDRDHASKNAGAMLRGELVSPYEFRIITKKGEIRWLMETITSIYYEGARAILGNSMDITDRKRAEEEMIYLSMTDPLTGLHNRRGFITLAEHQLKISKRGEGGMLLFFADLDGMKKINDTLGHEEGDKALIDSAMILKETFRTSDIIARMGGDEFAILAIDTTGISPEGIMTRLQNQIDKHNGEGNRSYSISISMGTSYYDPEDPCSLDELMSRADKLMYEHKKSKKS